MPSFTARSLFGCRQWRSFAAFILGLLLLQLCHSPRDANHAGLQAVSCHSRWLRCPAATAHPASQTTELGLLAARRHLVAEANP